MNNVIDAAQKPVYVPKGFGDRKIQKLNSINCRAVNFKHGRAIKSLNPISRATVPSVKLWKKWQIAKQNSKQNKIADLQSGLPFYKLII